MVLCVCVWIELVFVFGAREEAEQTGCSAEVIAYFVTQRETAMAVRYGVLEVEARIGHRYHFDHHRHHRHHHHHLIRMFSLGLKKLMTSLSL